MGVRFLVCLLLVPGVWFSKYRASSVGYLPPKLLRKRNET